MQGRTAGLIVAIIIGSMARAEVVGVFGPEGPDDRRIAERHDVDHPVIFDPASFTNKADWAARAGALRKQVLVAEGLWPLPPKTLLNAVIHGKIDRDAYTVEKVFFASYPGHYVSGNLYRPSHPTGKMPVVLCPHGHWPNGRFYERTEAEARKQIDEGAETTMAGARYPIQARCAMLARMGCVVFQYDMVGFADSTAIEHRTGFTDVESVLRLQSFMGLQTWNTIRAIDFVSGLPDVDTARIAVTGASGGGTQTIMICSIDDRVAAGFPAVMVSEDMQGGCICENAPLLRVGTNNVELIATFAPKPLGMSAANDWTVALETDALPKLKTIYGLFGEKDAVSGKHFPFEHNYNQVSRELMYNCFNQHLKLGWPSPVKEKEFEPIAPKELSVYDERRPRPADTANAATLRKYMTQSSEQQLGELFKTDPEAYRKTVRAALQVMVNDRLPGAGEVEVTRPSGPQGKDGIITETGSLGRRGSGEAVPYVSLIPQDWNGAVVVWAHPDGKRSLFDEGQNPSPAVRGLLGRKLAVVCADLFQTGEFKTHANARPLPPSDEYEKQKYPGFHYAYNRGTLANQVHDLLSEIALARGWKGARDVRLIGFAGSGPAAMLAEAIASEAVSGSAIDLAGFDFDRVTEGGDPLLLPGALKYGGIHGFAPLCKPGNTLLAGARRAGAYERAESVGKLSADSLPAEQLIAWIEDEK